MAEDVASRQAYPHPSSAGRSANMKANRRTDTKPELALRRALHGLGYRYRKDFRLDLDGGVRVRPDIVFVQGGVGGLLCAAVRHFGSTVKIVAVEPLDADCLLQSISSEDGSPQPASGGQNSIMQGLNCGEVSLTAWPTVRRGVDLFVAIADELALEAMEMLRPIDSGESGAAGLAGLIAVSREPALRAELGLGCDSRVLVINTEASSGRSS